jgi:hypothetical protein
MSANIQLLPASLFARLVAFSWTVTLLLALMGTALEPSSTDLSTTGFVEPTRLVLEGILTTKARFGSQKWTLGTAFSILMAAVSYLRMTTIIGSVALESTRWRLSTARQRCLQRCSAAITADIFKYSISACSACTFVT